MSRTILTNVTAPAGAPQFSKRLWGFPSGSLLALHRFYDVPASPGTAVTTYIDDVSGAYTAPVVLNAGGFGPPGALSLPGGGIRLVNRMGLPFIVPVTNNLPWTVAVGMALNPNSTLMVSPHAAYLLSGGNYNGLTVYMSSAPPSLTSASPLPPFNVREFESGGSILATSQGGLAGLNYGTGFVMFVTHYGNGVGLLEIWRQFAPVLIASFAMNLAVEAGAANPNSVIYTVGGGSSNYDIMDGNFEAMALWSKALTTAEKASVFNSTIGLSVSRGRAFA